MTSTATTPKVYVGTYAKYNNGSLKGAWMALEDYSDAAEFLAAAFALHEDENDAELMFQDYEGFPKSLYSESMGENDIQAIYDWFEIAGKLEDMDDAEWVRLHNDYCDSINASDDRIFDFDEDFFDTYFEGKPMEAARAATFGNLNWSDDYIMFNGYGNLVSLNSYSLYDHIDKEAIIKDITENPNNYSI